MIYLLCVMGGAVFGASIMCLMFAASEFDRAEEEWRKKHDSNQ